MENNQQQKDKFFTKLKYIIINYPIIECMGWIIAWYPAYSISAALLYILPGFAQFCYIIDALQKLLNIHFVEPIDKEIIFIIIFVTLSFFVHSYILASIFRLFYFIRIRLYKKQRILPQNHFAIHFILFLQHIFSWICYVFIFPILFIIIFCTTEINHSIFIKYLFLLLLICIIIFVSFVIKKGINATRFFLKHNHVANKKDYVYWVLTLFLFTLYTILLLIGFTT